MKYTEDIQFGNERCTSVRQSAHLSRIEKWLVIFEYLDILDCNKCAIEEKMIRLDEVIEFIKQNIDSKLSTEEALRRAIKYLFYYKKYTNSGFVNNFGNQKSSKRSTLIPDFKNGGGKGGPRPENAQREIRNLIKKILYKHIIIQTLLIFWILLILLINIDSIPMFLSNSINQALLEISLAIFSFIIYVMQVSEVVC